MPAAIDLVHFMTHNVIVKRVNIHDAKTHLSRYLAELTPGEGLVLCNRNRPVAELRSLRKKVVRKPRIGVARGEFVVPDSFFEPLPDEILKAFGGK
jgi:antitoxin (DNA-binding transcriptional repressor) of toxin-antitoxin stability system